MDRLARYAAIDTPSLERLTSMRAFDRFKAAILQIIQAQVSGDQPASCRLSLLLIVQAQGQVYQCQPASQLKERSCM